MATKLQQLLRKAPIVAVYFIGVIYTVNVLAKFNHDTSAIFNVAVAITAALAGLCFAMAAYLDKADEDKAQVTYSGERFFHASILFLVGAILKHAALQIAGIPVIQQREWLSLLSTIPVHLLALPMFLWAVMDAHSGITKMNDILWKRLYRDAEWDSIV